MTSLEADARSGARMILKIYPLFELEYVNRNAAALFVCVKEKVT